MDIEFKKINFYTLLGIPVHTGAMQVALTIEQHRHAKLLPHPILDAAKHYLLSDMTRRQYDFFLHYHPSAPTQTNIAQLDAYAFLGLLPSSPRQNIVHKLQEKWGEAPLQEWLLVRKWLLNPILRARYDGYWQQHFSPDRVVCALPVAQPELVGVDDDKPWWIGWALSAAAVLMAALIPPWHFSEPESVRKVQTLPTLSLADMGLLDKTSIMITAVGDMTLGSHLGLSLEGSLPHFWQQYGSSYFLENVQNVFAHDDLSIANLEGPLTYAEVPVHKPFAFKGEPALVQILEQGSIEAVNVANNHSHDYGQQGLDETLATLYAQDIRAFGYEHYQVFEVKGKRIALAGAKGWDVSEGKLAVDRAMAFFKREKIDYHIMSFHWGEERAYRQNAVQQTLGRYAIDQGFNAVLGHHPHVVQGIEQYKKGVIVYSLANFVFGGNRNPSDKDSLAVRLQLDFVGERLVATDVLPLPLAVSDTKNGHNYQPIWANEVVQQRVVTKMQPYSNIDVYLGQRFENSPIHAPELTNVVQIQNWCDDSLSVRAALFGHRHERFAKCQPRQTPAYWG